MKRLRAERCVRYNTDGSHKRICVLLPAMKEGFLPKRITAEIIVMIAVFFFYAALLLISTDSGANPWATIHYYLSQIVHSASPVVRFTLVVSILYIFTRVLVWCFASLFGGGPLPALSLQYFRSAFFQLIKRTSKFFFRALPAVVNILLFGAVIARLDGRPNLPLFNSILAEADHWLTGAYPFFWLGNQPLLAPLAPIIIYAFVLLAPVMILFFVFLYAAECENVRSRFIAAFFVSMTIAIGFWYYFPAHSPHDAFLDNLSHETIRPELAKDIANYHPPQAVGNFLLMIRDGKTQGRAPLPTTTMPSAHIIWATLLVYYLYRVDRRTLWVSIPYWLLSSLGTIYLVQHYLIDIPAGIAVGGAAILISECLRFLERLFPREESQ